MARPETLPLVIQENGKRKVKSLQDICRSSILKCLTLENVQQVSKLPLPSVIKEYLFTFHIPMDFDLDGIYMDYNFRFPNHVHHKNHQIHPGKCVLDGSKVLIKTQNVNEVCQVCQSLGNRTMLNGKEREKWVGLFHENLMNCHLGLYEPYNNSLWYVFDFPLMNLEDFVIKMFLSGRKVPEHTVWQILLQLTDLLLYLHTRDLHPWELCQPQHIVITEKGKIKMENMLLYLPMKSGSHFCTDVPTTALSQYTSPDQLKGQPKGPQTVIWGLGCILRELCAKMPSALLELLDTSYSFPPIFTNKTGATAPDDRYSAFIQKTITDCLNFNTSRRPSLKCIRSRAEHFFKRKGNECKVHSNVIAKSDLDIFLQIEDEP